MKKIVFLSFYILAVFYTTAQNTTIQKKNGTEREAKTTHKVMLIPFEPKLYLSEIDHAINAETGLSSKEIKRRFRDGLNEQLYRAFKAIPYNVVDLISDSLKYTKDLNGIYQHLTYQYQKVPNQEKYQAPKAEKQEKKIDKGQLAVETNSDQRFMNAKITDAKVVPTLYGKYNTDIFVFINQLDIKASGTPNSYNINNGDSPRKIVVHYTVYTFDAKEINSGIVEEEFELDTNSPKKIIDKHFSKISTTICERVKKALATK